MKLIVGLGNPGNEYFKTRHNVGFMVLDKVLEKKKVKMDKKKYNALFCEVLINDEKIIFLKPMDYVNLSGISVSKIIKYYKVKIEDILVIHDDLDLDLGKYKLKTNSNDGGHNGIKSIIQSIGTNSFKRLKIGIAGNKNIDPKNFVLGKFTKKEELIINEIVEEASLIVEDFIEIDFLTLMNKYN